jgi:hypothetical protein
MSFQGVRTFILQRINGAVITGCKFCVSIPFVILLVEIMCLLKNGPESMKVVAFVCIITNLSTRRDTSCLFCDATLKMAP